MNSFYGQLEYSLFIEVISMKDLCIEIGKVI